MRFGSALKALEEGAYVRRRGWNGKNMWLVQIYGDEWQVNYNEKTQIKGVLNELGVQTASFIAMKTAQNTFVPWLASQADMLAGDWEVTTPK